MKAVCLLSGGIDSPVAAYVMERNGADIALLHMDNRPYADCSAVNKALSLASRLEEAMGKPIDLYVAPHGVNQLLIHERCQHNLQCVLCKRTMLKTARNLARRLGADAVVTGESLGQVASQTLYNIVSEQSGLEFPVVRPLIGLDKLEIEAIAKRIGTYEISIQKGSPCTIVPHRPATMATPELMVAQEKRLDIERIALHAADEAFVVRRPSSSPT
ncbi:MAG: tRNA 4-thiouridine(8) synthase ThiI [Methanomassiliicoccus sp.]|nr:tRNA 4-thiouridine(8) synthase ThiI [Methanomassiliicoccus sp.]